MDAKRHIAADVETITPLPPREPLDQYRRLIESLTDYAIFSLTPDGLIATWNSGAAQTFGFTAEEVLGKPYGLLFTPEDIAAGRPAAELQAALEHGRESIDGWHVRKDGVQFWCTDTIQSVLGTDGIVSGFTKIVRDATERHVAEEQLRESEERLRLLIESVTEYAIFSIDTAGLILLWNSGAERIFGYTEAEVVGKSFSLIYTEEALAQRIPRTEMALATKFGRADDEAWHVRRDGSLFYATGQMTLLTPDDHGNPRGFVKVAHDITARNRADQAIKQRAFHDDLTGLPNRAFFVDRVRRAIARTKRYPQRRFAVIFLDLDRFKNINDSLGHVMADGLLVQVARLLEGCVRPEDVVARLGGDEFTILLSEIDEAADAALVATRIHAALQKPINLHGIDVFTTASMGIAIGSAAYQKTEHVLRDADTAMYEAKARGRSRHVLFDADMHARAVSLLNLQTDLRRAIEREEFFVEYQPVVRLKTNRLFGFEALVRWNHPVRGVVQPNDFISEAANIGQIVHIDHWVLDEACRQIRAWQMEFDDDSLTMSVNFSSNHFADEYVIDEIRRVLNRHDLSPASLKIEITESTLMEHFGNTTRSVARLDALGVDVFIDDFGTGYSSLSYLRRFPFKLLKIDRSFISDISLEPHSVEIPRAIVTLAHNLGLAALAEGIETEEQLTQLKALGCELGQGFLFSRPLVPALARKLIGRSLPLSTGNGVRSSHQSAILG
jgi:diguanylate cyclase (GGDEF)-like protein/PAS domain S-box-containing protein